MAVKPMTHAQDSGKLITNTGGDGGGQKINAKGDKI